MPPTTPALEVERYLTLMRDIQTLARELGVSREYVMAMKFHGFKMPGGKASIYMARKFFETCGDFKVKGRRRILPPPPAA